MIYEITWMDNLPSLLVVEQQHSIHSLCNPKDCSHPKRIAKACVETKHDKTFVNFHTVRWKSLSIFLHLSASFCSEELHPNLRLRLLRFPTPWRAAHHHLGVRTCPELTMCPGCFCAPFASEQDETSIRQQLVWLFVVNSGIQIYSEWANHSKPQILMTLVDMWVNGEDLSWQYSFAAPKQARLSTSENKTNFDVYTTCRPKIGTFGISSIIPDRGFRKVLQSLAMRTAM